MPSSEEAGPLNEDRHPGSHATSHDSLYGFPMPEVEAPADPRLAHAEGFLSGYTMGYVAGFEAADADYAASLSAWLGGHRAHVQVRLNRARSDRGEVRPPDALDENRRHDARVLRDAGVDVDGPGREAAA